MTKFGRLKIVTEAGRNWQGHRLCECLCDCGRVIVARLSALKNDHTRSCGCLQKEIATRNIVSANTKHGEASSIAMTAEYKAWASMHRRCRNPSQNRYKHYGGRGIRICERWNNYQAFLSDVGRKPSTLHSLDRIDVNGHYEPTNVRWATREQQAKNKRRFTLPADELSAMQDRLQRYEKLFGPLPC